MRLAPIRSSVLLALVGLAIAACSSTAPDTSATDAPASPDQGAAGTATLASGITGGTYHGVYAPALDASIVGWTIEAQPTGGSTENLDLLADGKVDLALAQADVYASRIAEEPDVFGPLVVIGPIAEECVFIAYRKGGELDDFDDLAVEVGDRAAIINLGTSKGGMAETWNYVSSLLPEHSNADIDSRDGGAALDALEAGELDAVAWMTDPGNADHVLLQKVRDQAGLAFLDVDDARLVDVRVGDLLVYHPRRIPIAGSPGDAIETICTSALLVARPDAPEGLMTALLPMAGVGN